MADKIKAAFDSIHAEDTLKKKTLESLRAELHTARKPRLRLPFGHFAAGVAVALCVAFVGLFSMSLYFTKTAYIDLDVNPSVGLAVNRFNRVVEVRAFNSDGEDILRGLDIKHKTYRDAIDLMLDALAQNGYLRDSGLVSVTLQTNDSMREYEMLAELSSYVQTGVTGHHCAAQVDVFPVSGDVKDDAYALDLSPAKYLAILELQEVDPDATVEGCRGHTIGELKSMIGAHGAGHHGSNGGGHMGSGMHGGMHR